APRARPARSAQGPAPRPPPRPSKLCLPGNPPGPPPRGAPRPRAMRAPGRHLPMRKTLLALGLALATLPAFAAQPLVPGKAVQGRLQASDRPSDRGGRSHDYSLRLRQGQLVVITARSEDFDPVLLVFGGDGELLAENDDHENGSTNAAVVMTAPETGTYTVRVNSLPMGDGHLGDYTLRAVVLED